MTDARTVVEAYWAAAEARDWEAFGALVADEVLYQASQTRERVRGRAAYVRFNVEGFPARGIWRSSGSSPTFRRRSAGSSSLDPTDGSRGCTSSSWMGLASLHASTIFWPDPYEPPASRAHLVERY